jgi:hypothetical protein
VWRPGRGVDGRVAAHVAFLSCLQQLWCKAALEVRQCDHIAPLAAALRVLPKGVCLTVSALRVSVHSLAHVSFASATYLFTCAEPQQRGYL